MTTLRKANQREGSYSEMLDAIDADRKKPPLEPRDRKASVTLRLDECNPKRTARRERLGEMFRPPELD